MSDQNKYHVTIWRQIGHKINNQISWPWKHFFASKLVFESLPVVFVASVPCLRVVKSLLSSYCFPRGTIGFSSWRRNGLMSSLRCFYVFVLSALVNLLPCYLVTPLPYYPVTLLTCYVVTRLHCFPVTLLPCYPVTLLPSYFLPCYPVTLLKCYPVTLLPCYPVTLLPCYLVTLLTCYPVILLLCYLVTLLPC